MPHRNDIEVERQERAGLPENAKPSNGRKQYSLRELLNNVTEERMLALKADTESALDAPPIGRERI